MIDSYTLGTSWSSGDHPRRRLEALESTLTCKLIFYLGLGVCNYSDRAAPRLWNDFLVPSAMSLFRHAKKHPLNQSFISA